MRLLLRLLRGRRRPARPRYPDPERLQRIYAETRAEVERLRRAA